jgi:hypothetical protein
MKPMEKEARELAKRLPLSAEELEAFMQSPPDAWEDTDRPTYEWLNSIRETITSLQAENADQRKRLEDAEAEVTRLRLYQPIPGTDQVCSGKRCNRFIYSVEDACGKPGCPIRLQEKK